MIKRIKNNNYAKAFFYSLLLGLIIILPSLILGKGILTVIDDFNFQQIPFNSLINELIKDGNVLWNWYNDLGSSFIGSFSFYNLGSPFVLINLLFPSSWFPYLIGPILILKYAVAGLTSYAFLQRYVKDKKYAIIGSLLYSFSGFQITNMLFYHFHDVVALFPLVLLSLDKLMYENKKGWFALSVALLALTNYFFFIGIVIFTIIYFIIKVVTKEYNINYKKFTVIIIEAILGTGIACFILLPSIVFVMGNPRVDGVWTIANALSYSIGRYADLFRAFIFPNEVMSFRSMIVSTNYRSVEMYLPFIGNVLMFSYLFKKKANWISILIVILILCMLVPILNSLFVALTTTYYARWFYMPILLFSLASIKALEEKISIKPGIIITLIVFVIMLIGGSSYKFIGEAFIIDRNYFFIILTLFILGLLSVILIFKYRNNENKFRAQIILGIFIFTAIMGNLFFYQNKKTLKNDENYIEYFLNINDYINIQNEDYERIDATLSCYENMGMLLKKPVINGFNSTLNGSIFDFYYSIDFGRYVDTYYKNNDVDLRNFLSVKYIISCSDKDNKAMDNFYELIEKSGIYTIYKNNDYLSMGINYQYYISELDFKELDTVSKKETLTKAIVLNENQIERYSYILKPFSLENFDYEINRKTSNEFKINNNGFTDYFEVTEESIILYTVPYDAGWSARINGIEVEIEKVDAGFMAIKLEKGINEVEFIYEPMETKIGIIVSIISSIGLFGYLIINKKKAKKDK